MSEYTKGPWKVSTEVAHRVIDDYATIAHCNVSSRDSFEAHANARLIAAAPTGHELIARAVTDRIDDQWLKEAHAYLEAVNGNS